uniref:undecaprenyldiphospho-muramoylpentapeptide beta-N-acetylglucosaminyltransferase n=1 Tax=Ningiella ruwaisensis TaxID=2364274 RepID=UPI0010A00FBF|nr:undecaprenyldiphospho-muramoylpentapeptide beta-N-acetylglucosaminyltransferase [Ningiella ruwaisensis]
MADKATVASKANATQRTQNKTIVIMAGGTGGHVFPGLAVADELSARGWQIEWFGTEDKMEAQAVPKHGYRIHFLPISGLRGKGIVRKLIMPFMLLKAVLKARQILKQLKADLVLGMGGYASGPGGIAAYTLRLPLVLHEQNAVFGMTNRYLSKIADEVLCGFDVSINQAQSKAPKRCRFVGNPIRASFSEVSELSIRKHTSRKPVNILVVGGSLGALALNEQLPQIFTDQHAHTPLAIKHQSGKGKSQALIERYQSLGLDAEVLEFIEDVQAAYDWADLVICRAGALTVAEVAAAGRPAIFVPLPIAVDDHQSMNANYLVMQEAAFVVQQKQLKQELPMHLKILCENEALRNDMAKKARSLAKMDAAKHVADLCESLAEQDTKEGSQ